MEPGDMGGGWNQFQYGSQVHKASLILLMIFYLRSHGCSAINLEGWALLKFRSKVDVDPCGALKNWNAGDRDPCNWTGVQCVDGAVESLNLKDLSLGGVLVTELGKLQNLKSLVLYKNNFYGVIPSGFEELTMLELFDLRCCNLKGTIPTKIEEMPALKHLLLCDENLDAFLESKCEWHHCFDMVSDIVHLNRKIGRWFKFKCISLLEDLPDNLEINLSSFLKPCVENNMQSSMGFNRRKLLLEISNLAAAPVTGSLPRVAMPVPSMGSGSFPAVPNVDVNLRKQSSESPVLKNAPPGYVATNQPFVSDPTGNINNETTTSKKSGNWIYIISLLAALFACTAIINSIVQHRRGGAAVAPWKTGLSGPLRKALISGATKLNKLEVEVACEDFSNIINTFPECIVFKGTLSSGAEIAVVSTVITSRKDWSRRAESRFREKIDALSKINHKNFVNLLGYCSENNPFMRMMVYEYAPNGTLFEHLHVKEFDLIDWAVRMRIAMGIAYCLQFMHHELNPPFAISELQSSFIFLTDDYAAKICDTGIWKDVASKCGKSAGDGLDPSRAPDVCSQSNVYSFGILLLEIISGKLSYSEEHGSILYWATEFLNDKHKMKFLVDERLKTIKNEELEGICEVIQECVHHDPKDRPTMKEVTGRLKDCLGISADAAASGPSPLWWAELEILSVET